MSLGPRSCPVALSLGAAESGGGVLCGFEPGRGSVRAMVGGSVLCGFEPECTPDLAEGRCRITLRSPAGLWL